MNNLEDILAIIFLLGGGTIAAVSFSSIGRAIADRIRGRSNEPDPLVLEELERLRLEMSEMQERLDFAERLIAQHKDPSRLGEPS
ncbi:MAG TPA: hypothetical protein VG817_00570 [Gemmatimonadales bacterium]|nr:hypothetical protein [Gemmatimonadales bacterium]